MGRCLLFDQIRREILNKNFLTKMMIFVLFHAATAFYNDSCLPDSLEQADLCIHDCQEDLLTCLRIG